MAGNRITDAISPFFDSVVTFCHKAWSGFKTAVQPSAMSSIAWTAAFPFFLYGYDVALKDSGASISRDLHFSDNEFTLYVTFTGRAAYAVGAVSAGVITNYVGRRYVLASSGALYTAGALVVTLATSYAVSTVGRVVACFGVGMGLLVGPIFIAETAPSTTRGYYGTFPQVLLVVGTIAAHVLELSLSQVPRHLAWRVMAGAAILPAACFTYTVVSRRFTDTPSWLAMLGQVRDAEQLMERCGADGTEPYERRARLERLARFMSIGYVPDSQLERFPRRITGFWDDVVYYLDSYPRDLCSAVVLYVAQEATWEQMALRLFPPVLRQYGLVSRQSFPVAGLVLACTQLAATWISMRAAARSMAGRRVLLLAGLGAATCFLVFLVCATFAEAGDRVSDGFNFGSLCFGILGLEAMVGFGPGPVPWMYGPEVFPLAVRAPSIGFCLFLRFGSGILLGWIFPLLYYRFERLCLGFLVAAGVSALFFLLSCWLVRRTTCRLLMDEPD